LNFGRQCLYPVVMRSISETNIFVAGTIHSAVGKSVLLNPKEGSKLGT
jgi:hypothetical protein